MTEREPSGRSEGDAAPKGLIDRLAAKSTGLPGDETPASPQKQADDMSMWKVGGLGLQFAGTVAIFLFMGRWIDNHFGWKFGATLTMLAIALVGSFYLLIKQTMKMDK